MLLLVGGVLVVALAGAGVAFGLGVGPFDAGETVDSEALDERSVGNASLSHRIDSVSECGRTCRVMNATVTNDGGKPAQNVEVTYNVFTASDDGQTRVWNGTIEIGQVDNGTTEPISAEIKVGLAEANEIRGNDGVVTVKSNVSSDQGSVVDTTQEDVL
jgi:hypothetical protein